MKKLLVVVDMQGDFISGVLGTKEAEAILPEVEQRIEAARRSGETVVFTRDTHDETYLLSQEGKNLPVVHCVRGSAGWQIADGLWEEGDKIFDKPAFGSTELGAFVAAEGFDVVELVGVCTDICVISNALLLKAYSPESEICVRAECCAGVTPQRHETALRAMTACQVKII